MFLDYTSFSFGEGRGEAQYNIAIMFSHPF